MKDCEPFNIAMLTTDVTNAPPLPENIEDGISEDGIVGDQFVETHYTPLEFLIEADGYLRVVGDNDFTNVEVRIPHERLNALGWHKQ
jgi:hypothetical protein